MTATSADKPDATSIWLRVGEVALAALAYFALARASLFFASLNASATPIWPPTGLAIALLLVRGNRMLPAVVLGSLAANFTTTPSLLTSSLIAAGNGLEAYLAALLIKQRADGERVFYSPFGIIKFAIIVSAVSAPVSATIGVLALAATGFAAWGGFAAVWSTWWLGNIGGAILTTPALVFWARALRGDEPREITPRSLVTFATAAFVGLIAFTPLSPAPPSSRAALAFLAILPLMWSALRLGLRDTATTALLISCLAIWGALAGVGPFIQPTLNDSLLLLIAFIVAATLPSLALAADRRETQSALDETRHELVQAQKLEALGTLTGSVAHDFNNLLAALSAGLRTLERQHEERLKTMEGLSQALERGSNLTRQLLAFARREPLRMETVDTREALESAEALIVQSLGAVQLEMKAAPGLWPVKVDRSQFDLALLNLALNARDAMAGRGKVVIRAENVVGELGKAVAISVSDDGPGMSAEVMERAFEPFFSTKPPGRGTGLGLAQVYGFAKQSGGLAAIDSAPGRGTTVTITLPRA